MKVKQLLLGLLAVPLLSGCGRMTPPIAPERVSPAAVQDLTVAGSPGGVQFSWAAPEVDQRGKPLTSLDVYEVLRREMTAESRVLGASDEFVVVGTIPDKSFAARKEAEEKLRAEGRPVRRAQVPADLKLYQFIDSSAQPGREYVYRVVAVNQGSERGAVGAQARVVFRGENSEIRVSRPGAGLFDEFEIESEG